MMGSRVCQFCDRLADPELLIYYAMRHYAHGKCLVERLSTKRILGLKTWPLIQLPALALAERGILTVVTEEL